MRCVVILLFAIAITACTPAPVRAPVDTPAFDAAAIVRAIRAAGAAAPTELDVQPLRNADVEDLRQLAAQHERAGRLADGAAALDQALVIAPDDAAVLQERSELAVLMRDPVAAERFARAAVDRGTRVGPLCRRHHETLAQLAELRAQSMPGDATNGRSVIEARARRDACTVAAPARY